MLIYFYSWHYGPFREQMRSTVKKNKHACEVDTIMPLFCFYRLPVSMSE